jgi:hypothetical protein
MVDDHAGNIRMLAGDFDLRVDGLLQVLDGLISAIDMEESRQCERAMDSPVHSSSRAMR